MDSPRGRIDLMRGLAEGKIVWSDSVAAHFDRCLGCMGCVPACPSGVKYDVLIEQTRAQLERARERPRAEQFQRVLRPDGSLVVNIKEGTERNERSTYVLELILAMRRAGWLWTEEYVWHKRNCAPGKWSPSLADDSLGCAHGHCAVFQQKF